MPSRPAEPILITGGRGILAQVVAAHYRAAGREVITYSRRGGDGHRPLAELLTPARPGRGGHLLHLAWSTLPFSAEQVPPGAPDPDAALLEQLLANLAGTPPPQRPHLVFFSSGGTVYGNAAGNRPSREDDACHPIGRHGQAKLAAERQLAAATARHGLATAILRISNPYGFAVPSARPQGIIPIAIDCARQGRPLTLWGDGTARKDFLHCTDFTAALDTILARRLEGVYNVGSGESHTLHEILALIERATGRTVAKRHVPAHPWDVHDSLLDNARLRAATGWTPRVSLEEGIRRIAAGPVAP